MNETIQKVEELLDKANMRYLSIVHSKAYTEEELVVNNDYNLGSELVDSVLVRINNEETLMVVVPSTRKISLESLKQELNNNNVDFIGKKEMKVLFPDYEAGTLPPIGSLYNLRVFCMAEMKKMQEVTFYAGTRSYRIRMKIKDFFKIVQPQRYIYAATTPRYRAEINQAFPAHKKQSLAKYDHCILGISLENKNFVTAKLVGMVDWASRNFKNCVILIGDSIHQYTLEIRGIDKSYAYDKALRLGREVIDANNQVFQSYAEHCNIEIILCSQIQLTLDYYEYYAKLRTLFDTDDAFSLCVRSFADTFVERRTDMEENYHDECAEKSCTYLLEELAIFACLSAQGHKVFIYPGALRVLTEIAMGLHPDTPQALKDLISIDLKIKRF